MSGRRRILMGTGTGVALVLLYVLLSAESGIRIPDKSSLPQAPGGVDWSAVEKEVSRDLIPYLRINTVRGNERAGALFLKAILEKNGIAARLVTFPGAPERAALVAELPGNKSDGGIILANHIDVVEANAAEWIVPPFSGTVKDGRIYGRGAIDMKGMGMMQLYAFILLKRMKVNLERKVMFLATADEESFGPYGAKYLTTTKKEIFQGYKYLWNEGGIGTKDVAFPGSRVFNLQYAEKGILWLKVKAKGTSGHGSTPHPRYAAADLLHFLREVEEMESGIKITAETAAFFRQVGEKAPFPNSFFLKRSRNFLVQKILAPIIQKNRHLTAMTSNTRSFTGLSTEKGGINVITSGAEGTIDIRLLPGNTPEEYLARLKKLADPHGVEIEVMSSTSPTQSPIDSEMFGVMARTAMENAPDAVVAPFLSPGSTDSAHYRAIGLECFGLMPALVNSDDLDGIHGKNENVSLENLRMGTKVIFEAVNGMNR